MPYGNYEYDENLVPNLVDDAVVPYSDAPAIVESRQFPCSWRSGISGETLRACDKVLLHRNGKPREVPLCTRSKLDRLTHRRLGQSELLLDDFDGYGLFACGLHFSQRLVRLFIVQQVFYLLQEGQVVEGQERSNLSAVLMQDNPFPMVSDALDGILNVLLHDSAHLPVCLPPLSGTSFAIPHNT